MQVASGRLQVAKSQRSSVATCNLQPASSLHQTAAILVGHGSLLNDAGAAMMRISDRLHQMQILPMVTGGFLNFSQPTFADALERCVQQGAATILVQPYFLIAGRYVQETLHGLIEEASERHLQVRFIRNEVVGTHPLLVQLARQRLELLEEQPSLSVVGCNDRRALLVIAHGTPLEHENLPIVQAVQTLQQMLGYGQSKIGYLDCNQPDIPSAFTELAAQGIQEIDVLPYFLHLGRHVRKDLPTHFAEAQERYTDTTIRVARHLDEENILTQICAERILESVKCL